MATIDLIVLGILKNESLSAYDIQKLVEFRNISKWVRISTPSIYKKVIQLEEKGFIKSSVENGKISEKAVYSLTQSGEKEFEELMLEIAAAPINIFLDFNAVIVNLKSLSKENQLKCILNIEKNIQDKKKFMEDNISLKENAPDIPETGMAVLQQQYILAQTIEKWIETLKEELNS